MESYDPKQIESKWQAEWERLKLYEAATGAGKPKFYALIEFPYPSGDGLHVGHPRPYIGLDIVARKRRAEGFNVLYPIGWDAFGLPTENYAIKTGKNPRDVTKQNTDNFRRQIKMLGVSFDWSREINTTDPNYYKWTQWLFLQFYKAGLAYKKKLAINWCPKDLIGLANEEVINGCCERCGTPVEKKEKEQWMLQITKYADRLDKDLDTVDYLPQIKLQQRNWIGRSEGAEFDFKTKSGETITVFTTRPDTLFGVTFVAISAKLAKEKFGIEQNFPETEEKLGVDSGVKVLHPATGEELPVWITNYVLEDVGTGAVMGVPAHDERDSEFAKKYNLPVSDAALVSKEEGIETGNGRAKTTYKLRDWVFSRQRYWGEPIPMINCGKCGWVPVPESELPVTLPEVEKYQPTQTGESPLAAVESWVNTKCPQCGSAAKRETDTMPNWAGSSWYYLRYTDPHNEQAFASPESLKYWTPVDWYNGGMEHTTLHLLYSRFWHKFLFDQGLVPTSEPYQKRTSHGLILAQGGEKMSKSKGNVVNPDQIVELYGADTLRVYEMFMGPFDQAIAWSTESMIGPRRFLEKVWRLASTAKDFQRSSETTPRPLKNPALTVLLHQTIKKVSEDIEAMKFNTAVSSLMILVSEMEKAEAISQVDYEILLQLLAPFAPHITEELWHQLGHQDSIHAQAWPGYDPEQLVASETTIVLQVNGVVRGQLKASAELTEEQIKTMAQNSPQIAKWLEGKPIRKVIYVKGKLMNFVV